MSQKFYSEVTLETLNNATTDTDRFLVGDSGTIKYRTGSQLLSDLGVSGLYVPYTGATGNVDLGTHTLSSYNLIVNHTSGSGVAASITKGGSGEALTINKTSGSGNAMSVTGGLTSLVNLTLSSIANATIDTDRFIVSDGGAIKYRTGAEVLSDIGGQAALTNPITGTGTTNYVSKFTGATTLGDSQIFDNGTNVGIGTTTPFGKLEIRGIESNTKDLLLNLSKYAYGATQFYQNYSNTFYTAGKSLEIEVEALPLLQLAVNNAGSAGKVIFPNGNVGIGTASPSVAAGLGLVLNGQAGQTRLAFKNNYTGDTSSDGVQFALIGGSSAFVFQNRESDGYFSFETNSSERIRITDAGNVGIGTSSPSQKLEVVGNAVFRSTQRIDISTAQPAVVGLLAGSSIGTYGNFSLISSSGTAGESMDISYWNGSTYYSAFGVANVASGFSNLLLMKNGGNVGIGTTSPNSPLQVGAGTVSSIPSWIKILSTGSSDTAIASAINNKAIYLYNNGSTLKLDAYDYSASAALDIQIGGNGGKILLSGGNVGIGTTSPDYPLEIENTNQTSIVYQRTGVSAKKWGFISDNGATYWSNITDNILSITLTNGGNVGIGTTSPGAKLDISQSLSGEGLRVDGAGGGFALVVEGGSSYSTRIRLASIGNNYGGNTPPNNGLIVEGNVGIGIASPTYKFEVSDGTRTGVINPNSSLDGIYMGVTQAKPLIFGTADTERMRITSSGNVGIGTTSPSYKLDVNGAGRFGADTYRVLSISDAGGAGWGTVGGASTAPQVYMFSTGTSAIVQTYINNTARLEVTNTGTAVTGAGTFSSSVTASQFNILNSNQTISIANTSDIQINASVASSNILFRVSGDERMRITASGNVGIGTTTPTGAKLDVNGSIRGFGAGNAGRITSTDTSGEGLQ